MNYTYTKTITVLGIHIPIEKNITYQPDDFIPDAIRLEKSFVEQEIMSYLCWIQFLDSHSASDKIHNYFARIAHSYSKDIILHQKKT